MTISVITYSNTTSDLKCYADSRISAGYSLLTNHAMKILPLSLSLADSYLIEHPENTYCLHQIGFTYARSVNVSMFVYCLLSHFCKNLMPNPALQGRNCLFPSIQDLSFMTSEILYSYVKDFASIDAMGAFSEIVIFGYCYQEKKYKAFHIQPMLKDSNLFVEVNDTKIDEIPFFAIGSGKDILLKKIHNAPEKHISKIVREIIADENSAEKGVGGFFQRALCNERRLYLFNENPSENINMPFLGKFPMVFCVGSGTHIVALSSLAYD